MSDIERRLAAVERALTDGDDPVDDLPDAAAVADRLDDLEARLDDVERRLDDLDAATQALRGYVGSVRAVDDAVERRADLALARTERLEAALDGTTEGAADLPDDAVAADPPGPHADPDERDGDGPRTGTGPDAGRADGGGADPAGADGDGGGDGPLDRLRDAL